MSDWSDYGYSKYKRIKCADGFNMSVQAAPQCYCSPRTRTGPYESVEVGFPSSEEELLMPFAENPKFPTKTVYGWVPAQTIREIIRRHGGAVEGELPPLKDEQEVKSD